MAKSLDSQAPGQRQTLNIFGRIYTVLKLLFLIDTSENPCTASCS